MITEKKDILILGKGPMQDYNIHWVQEICIQLILQKESKIFCLILHYNKENSYLFVNDIEIIKFKLKDPEILPNLLSLGNISKD